MPDNALTLSDQEGAWVQQLANRLRLVQVDAGAATPQQRREFLNEEIAHHLKGVSPARRKPLLETLLERFPVGGQIAKSAAVAPAPSPTAAPAAPETFDALFARFLKAAGDLPEAKRQEATKKLMEAALLPAGAPPPAPDAPEDLAQLLGLPAGQSVRLANVVRLCAALLDVFQRLDQTALGTMREVAPRSQLLRRPQDFRTAVLRYLSGEDDSIDAQVRMVSGLVGALLAAILGGGRDFGRHYVERLSPSAIEDVVMGEGGSSIFGKSKKERCWDKYVLLAREFETPDLVDRRVRDCVAAFVEKKVLGAR